MSMTELELDVTRQIINDNYDRITDLALQMVEDSIRFGHPPLEAIQRVRDILREVRKKRDQLWVGIL